MLRYHAFSVITRPNRLSPLRKKKSCRLVYSAHHNPVILSPFLLCRTLGHATDATWRVIKLGQGGGGEIKRMIEGGGGGKGKRR